MKDLAPEIVRQRLLIEGRLSGPVDASRVEAYLRGVAAHLGLRVYGSPIIHSPKGIGKSDNEGFDAFIPLIDSGISLYVWTVAEFFSVVLFTCKHFENDDAVLFTRNFFETKEIESASF